MSSRTRWPAVRTRWRPPPLPGPGGRRRVLSALLIPAEVARPVRLLPVADAATAISDLLGGVLLDDPVTWCSTVGTWISAYLGERRGGCGDNPRLSLVATRLGLTDRWFHACARGDALLLATRPGGVVDDDLPEAVVAAVRRSGLIVRG